MARRAGRRRQLGDPSLVGGSEAGLPDLGDHHLVEVGGFLDDRVLRARVALGPVDEALADDLGRAYRERPWTLALAPFLWRGDPPGPALEQLRLGEVAAEDRAALDALFPATGYWNARGAAGHVDALAAVLAERGVVDPDDVVLIEEVDGAAGAGDAGAGADGEGAAHPLLGHPCPELTFTAGGETRRLSEIPGGRVVELWNTW